MKNTVREGAGEGSSDGSTRRKVTSWLEDCRAALLKKGLEEHLDQTARPVWAHPQLDKLSQGWILSLPGPGGLGQAEFSETVARHLCLPSPSPLINQQVRQSSVCRADGLLNCLTGC